MQGRPESRLEVGGSAGDGGFPKCSPDWKYRRCRGFQGRGELSPHRMKRGLAKISGLQSKFAVTSGGCRTNMNSCREMLPASAGRVRKFRTAGHKRYWPDPRTKSFRLQRVLAVGAGAGGSVFSFTGPRAGPAGWPPGRRRIIAGLSTKDTRCRVHICPTRTAAHRNRAAAAMSGQPT